ncbi:hypothetical protein [Streptomyces sp. NPDC054771]
MGGRVAVCPVCGQDVVWTITEAGKRLAVDAVPDPVGNAAVYRDGTGTYRSRRPSEELPLMGWERLHVPHVASCGVPDATRCLGLLGPVDLGEYRTQRARRGR